MNDLACACGTTNTFQNEIDEVTIAVSDLQNLSYIQHLLLTERLQHSSERDALFTLHHAFRDRLEALQKRCGTLSNAYSYPKTASTFREYAGERVAHPQPINTKNPLPD
ncbi:MULTISPECIES: hypothetical protein [unclassified Pseudovibrio]|uniref:hypothetical protein n=1 Tax=unclassified Pseudovibrio TaxID=2627060 RepID=UPI0007AE4176|nr:MULTISPECIES: hypothetical protein [unclassified Pseudovibrio]KZL14727.1 hypothetical protein PsAD37_04841 [Pseudovibrio sp. Ad37]KZL17441.1 hypothetical protein PsWM33_05178 [Pseudovibrio sp. WM33]